MSLASLVIDSDEKLEPDWLPFQLNEIMTGFAS